MKTTKNDPWITRAYQLALSGIPAAKWPPEVLRVLQLRQLSLVKWDVAAVL